MKPVHSFIVTSHLPKKIAKLKELAYNYWWCWNSEAKELFVRINRKLWEEANHNPVLLMNKLSQVELEKLSEQTDFTSFLDYIYDKFRNYMEAQTWYDTVNINGKGSIVYFSMEYGINESFPNYSGGLGVLSGDHLKSASDLGLPLIAVGLLYQQGYFRQRLTQSGWQNEQYIFNDFYSMPITLMRDKNDEPVIIDVDSVVLVTKKGTSASTVVDGCNFICPAISTDKTLLPFCESYKLNMSLLVVLIPRSHLEAPLEVAKSIYTFPVTLYLCIFSSAVVSLEALIIT